MKEEMITKIRQIVAAEKFKLDAFYLCGAAAGLPNERLQKACEAYLAAEESGAPDPAITAALVAELEKAITTKPEIQVVGDLMDNKADIETVYADRDFL